MNNETESTSRVMKTLAVFGFLALVIFGTWLAVNIVRLVPGTFASLASLAESVQIGRQDQNNITIESTSNVVNSGESFSIAWSDLNRSGNYTFNYECSEGVSAQIKMNGEIISVPCGTTFMLPTDTFALDAQFTSAKKRFVDIAYQIGFVKTGESDSAFNSAKTITLVNGAIPTTVVTNDPEPEVVPPTPVVTDPTPETPVTPTTPTTPTPVKPTTYTITEWTAPVSNPNGVVDLAAKFIAVGTMSSNNTFVKKSELEIGDNNAFQFEVKNIGTKTSTTWTFEAKLPNGETFKSKVQDALKPNEYAILTLAFGADAGKEGTEKITVEVKGGSDSKTSNNEFTTSVKVTD